MHNGDLRDVLHPGGPDVHACHLPRHTRMPPRHPAQTRGPAPGRDHARPAAPTAGERAKAQGTEVKDRGRAAAGLAVPFKAATGKQA
jgi:hypothetical protein